MIAGLVLMLIGGFFLVAATGIRSPLEALGWIIFGLPLAFIFLVLGLIALVAGSILRRVTSSLP